MSRIHINLFPIRLAQQLATVAELAAFSYATEGLKIVCSNLDQEFTEKLLDDLLDVG